MDRDEFPEHVSRLYLTADHIAGTPQLPARLDHLSIRLRHGHHEETLALVEGAGEIRSLSLRGTPVHDETVVALVQRYHLDSVDLVDTAVTAELLSHLSANHPDLGVLPRDRPQNSG